MFYFDGYDKPLIIEADNRDIAIEFLRSELEKIHPYIKDVEVVDIKVMTPVFGVTEKEEKGNVFIWAGFDHSPTGWLIKNEFEKIKDIEL